MADEAKDGPETADQTALQEGEPQVAETATASGEQQEGAPDESTAVAEGKPAEPQAEGAVTTEAGATDEAQNQEQEKPPSPAQEGKPATPEQPDKPAAPEQTEKPPTPQAEKPPTPTETVEPAAAAPGQTQETTETPAPPGGAPPPTAEPSQQVVPAPPPQPQIANRPETAKSEDGASFSALAMSWSFGMNKHVPVLNLTDGSRKMIMYPCAHTGVLYSIPDNSQQLLQGHSNAISCTCVSADKRWVATADRGPDNMIIVWDSHTGVPVRTIFDPHPDGGVVAIAMTPDAKYIATLSAGGTQIFAIWDWTVEGETPLCTAELHHKYGVQNYILFNPEDTTQIVTNSETQVIFYSWKEGKLEYFAPPLSDDDFNKPVGKFSQSIFQSNSTRALTATSIGNLVVWATNKPLTKVVTNEATPDKKALKLVKLQDKGINVITTTDEFIVTGDVLGHVKFFDQTLKLMNWYQDFHLGPINSLSFAHVPEFVYEAQMGSDYPPDATIAARQFVIRDFVVGTTTAIFASVTTDGTDIKVIHRDHDAAVHALDAHPTEERIVVGSYSGLLKIWDYQQKSVLVSRLFDRGQMIRCCAFDPKGQFIAVGFLNGTVRVVDATTLEDQVSEPFRYARDAVTHVCFSHDSAYLATADAEFTVSVFKANKKYKEEPWVYLGRHRAHYKLIQDIMFGVQLDSDQPRLLSLGEDRVLVEYDLQNSHKDDLRVLSSDRIEQSAVPMCMGWYPPVTKESFIVTANDQFKFKLYNATTKMCRKTLLGPTYGTPLQKITIIPNVTADPSRRYMAYITTDKVGLQILPLDGNPHNAMALIAHPQGVAGLCCSNDGKYLFTAGGLDSSVHMWDINIRALEAQSSLGGEDLIPFYGLLDGDREGELFRELEDYFYYAQLRSQGVDTMDRRAVSTTTPLSEVPFIMRALGFYPSEQEIEDMLNEVKYSQYVETGQYVTDIDLANFIRLYINHRPAFGLQPEKLLHAFEVLGFNTEKGPAIDRGELLDLLQSRGEHMTELELAEYLTTLMGYNEEGGSSELHEFDPTTAGDIIDQHLPQDITAELFANELLGLGIYSDALTIEDMEEPQQTQQAIEA